MATFLLLPGAGGSGWLWSKVAALLERAGHTAIAVDFPGPDPNAGLAEYAKIAIDAVGDRKDVIVVAQSMAGFTAPLVAEKVPVRSIVFVNAMIPLPGETPGAWWGAVESTKARIEAAKRGGYTEVFDLAVYFVHDMAPELVEELNAHAHEESEAAFNSPCTFERWPAVRLHVIVAEGDRFFPADFQERVARERLGAALTSVERVPGGHLAIASEPQAVAERLLAHV